MLVPLLVEHLRCMRAVFSPPVARANDHDYAIQFVINPPICN